MNDDIMEEYSKNIWNKFLRNHWKMLFVFIIVAIFAFIAAIYVFLWFVGDAQSTGLVPTTLGLWTMGHFVTFILHLILWELIYVGIPIIIAAASAYFLWWKKIPKEERREYKRGNIFGKSSKRRDASGGISFLIFIFFVFKIYLDGNWDKAFATWKFDYLVSSWMWALIWVLIIFGIPILLGGLWWISTKMKKSS